MKPIALLSLLLVTAASAGSVQDVINPASLATCMKPKTASTPVVGFPAKKGPYKIAFSNSYFGNNWRAQMLKVADIYAAQPDIKAYLSEFKIYNTNNDVQQQIAQIRQMILANVDAIVVNAASPTGLNSVLEQAAKRGIVIVAFDNTVTAPSVFNVNKDQYAMGQQWADFLVKQIKGEGTVLMVRGLAGTSVDNDQGNGAMSVFSKNPKIKVVSTFGNWDVGTNQKVTSSALAANPKIDAVWGTAGGSGIMQAFVQAGRPLVPMTAERDNGFMRLAVKNKVPVSVIGQPPAMVAVAMRAAIALLSGQKLPKEISLPLETITTATIKAGVNYFPELPDSFITDVSIPACGVQIAASQIVK
ncbi:substrate-binding domain-containing protein [Deinococcus sp. SM5_A1]|uniref:substrate-binding domain-containing protein n=1 Tax=Deinococcus sp. SM5_A1 TaxID=3379094 RepID=UPI00385A4427